MGIDCCEFPSDAVEKASQWCLSGSFDAKMSSVMEFQISGLCGNHFASAGCIIIHDMCIPSELRCFNEVLLFLEYLWSTSDCVQSVRTTLVWPLCSIPGSPLWVIIRSIELKLILHGLEQSLILDSMGRVHMQEGVTCSVRLLLLIGSVTTVHFLNLAKILVWPKQQHGDLLYSSLLYLAKFSGMFSEFLQGCQSFKWLNACCATLVEPCFHCSVPDHSYKWLMPWSTTSELASTKIKTSLLHNVVSSITVDGQARPAPVCITELVGTVGDMETMLFIEAVHQLPVSLLVKVVLHSSVACSLKPSIQWAVASDFEDASATSALDAHATSWKTYMLQHWNSCRQSAMTRAFFHVSASGPIPITFQLFSMSLELAFNHVANGHRVLLILGHYDALRHSVLWPCTAALLSEIVNIFNAHPSAAVMIELVSAVAADHSWDVLLFLSMHPSISFDTVQSLFAANMNEELVSPAAVAIWWFRSAPCKYLVAFRLYTHFHDTCTYTGELWNEVMASSNSIQYVALKYMKFWWFTTAIWTEFTGSIFSAGFSLQTGAT
ncbi:hypothetical protein ACQ4PT_007492 [Festuca glaucescens]